MADSDHGDEQALLSAVDSYKRHTVAAACEECRRRKTKCDGVRPVCSRCAQRSATCNYLVEGDETQRQGAKRKHDAIVALNTDYKDLHEFIVRADEHVAAEIFKRVRDRQSAHSILDALQHGSFISSTDRALRHRLMLALFQSSASLCEILQSANNTSGISYAGSGKRPLLVARPEVKISASNDELPPLRVPASPWTTLASSDLASQLISVYFLHLNPAFPSIDEEIFLEAMVSRKIDSSYCSPFLVHCIFALAATYIDTDEVFDEPGEMLTRGDRFYREALCLSNKEPDRVALPYLQGLMVLAMAAANRGRDRDGYHFLDVAIQLGKNLEIPMFREQRSLQLRYDPVRSASLSRPLLLASASLLISEMSFASALMKVPRVPEPRAEESEALKTVFSSSPRERTPFPLSGLSYKIDTNTVVCARWELVRLAYLSDAVLLHRKPPLTASQLWTAAEEWEEKFVDWYHSLPTSLHYSKDMPIPHFELHNCYLSQVLHLHTVVRGQLDMAGGARKSKHEVDPSESSIRSRRSSYKAAVVACKIAALSKDYRETYGLRIMLPFIIQPASMASSTLLRILKDASPLSEAQHIYKLTGDRPLNARAVEAAFEEVFRCLVAAGLQNLFARASARMVLGTAQEMHVTLPDSVLRMTQLIQNIAWQQQDRFKISSVYPNIAVALDLTNEEYHMDEMLRKYDALDVKDEDNILS